ncbi:MAG: 6-carboxytetrahydropterin synthase [Desulfurococcales archaeon]|jgi:6-pyruvoyl-tetrahydropterin synthase|nr:6-carboxytetrahydropterin synthase [Desulfurococcales archaeon]
MGYEIYIGVRDMVFEAMHITEGFLSMDLVPHGHTYRLSVEVSGDIGEKGYILDLRELERIAREVVDELNRALIIPKDMEIKSEIYKLFNKIIRCEKGNPTIENIALMIAEKIYSRVKEKGRRIKVTLYEGPNYFCTLLYPL